MLFDQFLGSFWDLFGTILDIKIALENQSKTSIVLGSFGGPKMVPKWYKKLPKIDQVIYSQASVGLQVPQGEPC